MSTGVKESSWTEAEEAAAQPEDTGFKKFDAGKARFDLLPPEAVLAVAEVFTYGAAKYSDNNWKAGTKWGRYYAAALRHLNAWRAGEDADAESGFPHLAHAVSCILILMAMQSGRIGEDDRG